MRVAGQPPFALDVLAELNEPAVQLGHALGGARLLVIERLSRHRQALQRGGGARFSLAQGRQCRGRERLALGGIGLFPGALGNDAHRCVLGVLGFGQLGIGGEPTQV